MSDPRKAIAIVLPTPPFGYGDMLFALKLTKQLREKLRDIYDGEIVFITDKDTADKINRVEGDKEFDITVRTLEDIKKCREGNDYFPYDLDFIIYGPFVDEFSDFKNSFLGRLGNALWGESQPPGESSVKVVIAPEYCAISDSLDNSKKLDKYLRSQANLPFKSAGIVWTGFNVDGKTRERKEHGIIATQELLDPTDEFKREQLKHIPSNLSEVLFESSPALAHEKWPAYTDRAELYIAYSHDYYWGQVTKASKIFLHIHREFVRDRKKNQDIILIGGSNTDASQKYDALNSVKDKLIRDGFSKIIFYNAITRDEDTLYESDGDGPTYRAIYTKSVPHKSMIALTAISGELIGATGDQSFGEALSTGCPFPIYESLKHKKELKRHYCQYVCSETINPDIKDLIELLFFGECDEPCYTKVGELIRKPAVAAEMRRINKKLCLNHDLVQYLAEKAMDSLNSDAEDKYDWRKEGKKIIFRYINPDDHEKLQSKESYYLTILFHLSKKSSQDEQKQIATEIYKEIRNNPKALLLMHMIFIGLPEAVAALLDLVTEDNEIKAAFAQSLFNKADHRKAGRRNGLSLLFRYGAETTVNRIIELADSDEDIQASLLKALFRENDLYDFLWNTGPRGLRLLLKLAMKSDIVCATFGRALARLAKPEKDGSTTTTLNVLIKYQAGNVFNNLIELAKKSREFCFLFGNALDHDSLSELIKEKQTKKLIILLAWAENHEAIRKALGGLLNKRTAESLAFARNVLLRSDKTSNLLIKCAKKDNNVRSVLVAELRIKYGSSLLYKILMDEFHETLFNELVDLAKECRDFANFIGEELLKNESLIMTKHLLSEQKLNLLKEIMPDDFMQGLPVPQNEPALPLFGR